MLEFKDSEWFQIIGRGDVYSTRMPETVEGSIINTEVNIDGHVYLVVGTETFTIGNMTLHKDRAISLLIRGPRKDK